MSYNFNSIVGRQEANALKEMIFQRVRERSEALTDDIQADVMDIARESFVKKDNPFSQIINRQPAETPAAQENKVDTVEISSKEETAEIGFPMRELKSRAVEQEKVVNEQITAAAVNSTMSEAREKLSNKKSFMGALNFLNSQAAVSLMRTSTERFEVVG